MNATVRAELEHVEQMALGAASVREELREGALAASGSHAAAALATLVHLGLITPEEDREWRARLRPALGDRIRLARARITRYDDDAVAEPNAEDQARYAYAVCRDLSLSQLAWTHHTAATEEAIADALAADSPDPERVRHACAHGFTDRGKTVVPMRDL
jgi:hypothetical protein